ncbi:MAG: threonine aldolase family protein [Pseudomonadota bacterium]
MSFLSDNTAPVAPAIMEALEAANRGSAAAYGDDPWTARLDAVFSEIFERPVRVFPLVTGTAANAIAAAVLSPPYGAVFVHEEAHMEVDECGAPEFFTGGAKLGLVAGTHGRMSAEGLRQALARYYRSVHMVEPAAVSLTQSTELGTVYRPADIAAIAEVARGRGMRLHMDGARFANALVHLGCAPADISWRAGVDVMSFGATKNGALAAEALIYFDPALVRDTAWRRKRAGHLVSKMRYVSAQLLAYVENDLWRANAAHANAMAARIAAAAGSRLIHPVEANALFLALDEAEKQALREAGFGFYDWGAPGSPVVRLVTHWASEEGEVERFIAALKGLARAALSEH